LRPGECEDPTEAERRKLLPIVNQPTIEALRVANEAFAGEIKALEAREAAGTMTAGEAADLRDRRDAEAKRLLRAELVAKYGEDDVYDTSQLSVRFDVVGFMAPFVVARRKADAQKGTLTFTHRPRFYFGWQPDQR
jgi:hypothetical protein